MSPKGIVWKEGKTEFPTLEKPEKKDEPQGGKGMETTWLRIPPGRKATALREV